jgi:hypothetical protein
VTLSDNDQTLAGVSTVGASPTIMRC